MRTVAWASMAVALLVAASQIEGAELQCDTALVGQAWDLLKLARYGHSDQERAAFIVRDAAGRQSLQAWSDGHTFRGASYEGRPPGDAVAIIHTHPNALPYPSIDDERTAARTGLPVWVVTRMMITGTTGHGVQRCRVGDWKIEARRGTVPSVWSAQVAGADAPTR